MWLVVAMALTGVGSHANGATCAVAAVSLAFGNYDSFGASHTDSVGDIAVTCSGKPGEVVTYSIALSAGTGGFAQRALRSASGATLGYNLYSSGSRTLVWGDGNSGSIVVSDSWSLGAASATRNYPVYGRLSRGQKVPVATYSDSIVVTLLF